jgi:anti-anti-sigma factor
MPPKLFLVHPNGRRPDAPPSTFECSWTDDGLDGAWVRLTGELDAATAPRLERLLREPRLQARVIVLDLRDLAFVDSSGVHAIVDASIRSRQAGQRMLLLRGRAGADRVFTLTGTARDVGNGDIHAVEPSVHALRQLVAQGVSP